MFSEILRSYKVCLWPLHILPTRIHNSGHVRDRLHASDRGPSERWLFVSDLRGRVSRNLADRYRDDTVCAGPASFRARAPGATAKHGGISFQLRIRVAIRASFKNWIRLSNQRTIQGLGRFQLKAARVVGAIIGGDSPWPSGQSWLAIRE